MNSIVELTPDESEKACRDIAADLPEWFGISEANERYANGVKECLNLGYRTDGACMGMLSLEFQRDCHGQGLGKALLRQAEKVCKEKQIDSLSVEILSPKEKDANYLKTYDFYVKEGFKPLFELNTYSPEFLMIYMHKSILS